MKNTWSYEVEFKTRQRNRPLDLVGILSPNIAPMIYIQVLAKMQVGLPQSEISNHVL